MEGVAGGGYIVPWRGGAPRPMKMGTILSPCPCDAAALRTLQSVNLRRLATLRYASWTAGVPIVARWSGCPSIAALSLNPGIDVMCQTLHFALQEKQQPFSRDDASLSLSCQPSWVA